MNFSDSLISFIIFIFLILSANIYHNNQTTRHITLNSSFHKQTEYINIHCHMVEKKNSFIYSIFFRIIEQPVNIFIKASHHGVFARIQA